MIQINSPLELIQWQQTCVKTRLNYEDKCCLLTFKFKFMTETIGLTNFTRDFAEKAITIGLRNMYGIVGMGNFSIKLIEAMDSTAKVQLSAKLLCQFWTAMIFITKVNNLDFRVYFVEAQIQDEAAE